MLARDRRKSCPSGSVRGIHCIFLYKRFLPLIGTWHLQILIAHLCALNVSVVTNPFLFFRRTAVKTGIFKGPSLLPPPFVKMLFFPNKCSRLFYSSFSLLLKLSLFLLLSVAMTHMTTSCLTAAGGSGGGRYCCTSPPPPEKNTAACEGQEKCLSNKRWGVESVEML